MQLLNLTRVTAGDRGSIVLANALGRQDGHGAAAGSEDAMSGKLETLFIAGNPDMTVGSLSRLIICDQRSISCLNKSFNKSEILSTHNF